MRPAADLSPWSAADQLSRYPCGPTRMADTTLSFRAETQRISLMLGVADVNGLVSWADAEIEASDVPAAPLFDLSLGRMKSRTELLSFLNSLVTEPTGSDPLKIVLRIVARRIRDGSLDVGTAIQSIFDFLKHDRVDDDLYITFVTLEDDYADIRDGVYGNGDFSGLRESLLHELDAFTKSDVSAG